MKQKNRDYYEEAYFEVLSLCLEGYRYIGRTGVKRCAPCSWFLRHFRNGRRAWVKYHGSGWQLFINNQLVKSEPI